MHLHAMTQEVWSDVRFDLELSEELVRQLVATAGAVGDVLGVLSFDLPLMAEDWLGPHRLAFDDDRARLLRVGEDLLASLLAAARDAAALLAAAEAEQRLRSRLRDLADPARCLPGEAC
jgi:hypothetical protein